MPLVDQYGKIFKLERTPSYDVKIVASRIEIVRDNGGSEDQGSHQSVQTEKSTDDDVNNIQRRANNDEYRKYPKNVSKPKENIAKSDPIRPSTPTKTLRPHDKQNSPISKNSSTFKNLPTIHVSPSTSRRRKKPEKKVSLDVSSPSSTSSSNNHNNDNNAPDNYVAGKMASVSQRTMNLMIMELRTLDRY